MLTTDLAPEKTFPTSIKLPASVKAQIDEAATKAGMSSHGFMVKALVDAAARARLRGQFDEDALASLQKTQASGLAFDFADIESYLTARSRAEKPARPAPKPWRGA